MTTAIGGSRLSHMPTAIRSDTQQKEVQHVSMAKIFNQIGN
jgi:hypothetical protein